MGIVEIFKGIGKHLLQNKEVYVKVAGGVVVLDAGGIHQAVQHSSHFGAGDGAFGLELTAAVALQVG